MQDIKVVILDDLGSPSLEGVETFDLILHMPVKAILGEPKTAKILINDSESDCKFLLLLVTSPLHRDGGTARGAI